LFITSFVTFENKEIGLMREKYQNNHSVSPSIAASLD
jgi:hypothetical protein